MDPGDRYLNLLDEIAKIAESCDRRGDELTLISVSKFQAHGEISNVYQKGCRDFGESRIQEALVKCKEMPQGINWHLIGHLQKNKVKQVIGKFALIHSVHSLELAKVISTASAQSAVNTSILLQVNTSGEASKQGMTEETCIFQFDQMLQLPGIAIQGLMTMAPLEANEKEIRLCFAACRHLRDQLQTRYPHILLPYLSMGMSNDFKEAIQEGATHLRIGSLIFNP